jgi:hypothetical protein
MLPCHGYGGGVLAESDTADGLASAGAIPRSPAYRGVYGTEAGLKRYVRRPW